MTVIAVRAGIMACDSAWAWAEGESIRLGSLQTKITETKHGVLIGGAGDCSDRDIMRTLEQVRAPSDFPSLADLGGLIHDNSGLELLLYFPDRQIWFFCKDAESAPELYRVGADYAAAGSGAGLALVAMDLGCSAQRAVEMACNRDMMCRPPVHSRQLRPQRARNRAKRR